MEIVEVDGRYYLVIERDFELYYCEFKSAYDFDRYDWSEGFKEVKEAYYLKVNS